MTRKRTFAIRLVNTRDPYRIRLVAPFGGNWLTDYDPDAHDGIGEAHFSPESETALQFASIEEATEFWKQSSTVRPYVAEPGPMLREAWDDAVAEAHAAGKEPPGPLAVDENRPLAQATNISIDELP